ncbi:hypothetical protein D3C71_315750 [compost metagenome]
MFRMMLLTVPFIIAAAATSAHAEACYDYRLEPSHMDCEKKEGNSADFTSSCTFTGEKIVKIQVACPVVKPSQGSSSGGGGSGSSYGDGCACDHSSSGGWH